jgi:hypothetical protein
MFSLSLKSSCLRLSKACTARIVTRVFSLESQPSSAVASTVAVGRKQSSVPGEIAVSKVESSVIAEKRRKELQKRRRKRKLEQQVISRLLQNDDDRDEIESPTDEDEDDQQRLVRELEETWAFDSTSVQGIVQLPGTPLISNPSTDPTPKEDDMTPNEAAPKIDRRYRRPKHVAFNAQVAWKDQSSRDFSTLMQELEQIKKTTVFVDNLPIDMTAEKLTSIYESQCRRLLDYRAKSSGAEIGTIDSILADCEVFNRRVDLDPGPLSLSQRKERKKKRMLGTVAGDDQSGPNQWSRPRTPVYGRIQFSQESHAQQVALDDSLRIFGMIVQRHPIRSHRPSTLCTLYVDERNSEQQVEGNVEALNSEPNDASCLDRALRERTTTLVSGWDMERHLSSTLNQFDSTLLDFNVTLSFGQNPRTIVGSYEIRFPSFEAAWIAYKILSSPPQQQSGSASSIQAGGRIQWFRTPRDANLWWSRQYSFD